MSSFTLTPCNRSGRLLNSIASTYSDKSFTRPGPADRHAHDIRLPVRRTPRAGHGCAPRGWCEPAGAAPAVRAHPGHLLPRHPAADAPPTEEGAGVPRG